MEKENTLLEKNKLFSATKKVAQIGIFQLDLTSNSVYWNDDLKEIHQVPLSFSPSIEGLYGNCTNVFQKELLFNLHKEAINEGIPFEISYEILTKQGQKRNLRTTVQPIFKAGRCTNLHGTTVEVSQFENSNIETVQYTEQLNTAEILANSGSWKWNIITDELIWSDNFYTIFDHKRDTPISYDVYLNYVHKEDRKKISAKFESALKNKIFPESIYRIQLADGIIKTLNSSGKVIINEKGDVVSLMGTCQDITEQVAKEQELSEKKQQLELSESINKAGSWQFTIANGEFKWSDNLYTIFNLGIGEKMNFEKLKKFIHPEDIGLIKEKLEETIKEKKSHTFTHRIILKNNTIKTVRVVSDALTNDKGEVVELIGTTQDITKRLDVEKELKEKNQLLDFAENLTTMGYWKYKPETDDVFWSDNLYTIFDIPKEKKITFDTYFDKIHPADKDIIKTKIDQSISEHKFHDYTHRIITDNNIIKTVQILGKATYNAQDGLQELLGACLDITENQTKELVLAQKNHQLNSAEKMAKIGYWHWNTASNEVYWSDNLHAIYGHDKNKPLNFETYISYIHKDDRAAISTKLSNAIIAGDFPNSTYKIQLNDGSIKTIKSIGKIVRNQNGEVLEMSGTCQDITSLIRTEKELKEKNRLLSVSEEMAMMGSWKWNPGTGVSTWSDNLYQIYGIDLHTPITIELFLSRVHPNDVDKVNNHIAKILETRKSEKILTFRIIKGANSIRSLELIAEVIEDKHGNILELIGSTQDVTDKVKARKEIKEKNQLLSYAEEISNMGSWHWDLDRDILKWSDNLYKIYRLELDATINMEKFYSQIHPDDIAQVKTLITESINGNEKIKLLSFRIILDDGTIRSIESRAETKKNHLGKVVEMVGTAQDITEKLKIEKDILEKNHMLNFAEELAMIGYWQLNVGNGSFIWSNNMYRIFGFEMGITMNFDLLLSHTHPADRELVMHKKQNAIATKKFEKFTQRILHEDGEIRFSEIVGKVITDKEGNATKIIGSSRDITEEILAQQKILETNKNLEESTIKLTAQNKQLAEFNQITSHNLRAPVSNLNALLKLYNKTQSEGKKIEIFEKFEIVIERLTETLNALVETITIKKNGVEIMPKLEFEQVLLKTKQTLAATLIETKAKITYDFSKAKNVDYNPIYLESIFLNLISNAIKYRSPDRVPQIFITSKKDNNRTVLEFKDNGLGIDLKNHGNKLFGLNQVFHKHPESKGIGLFITKAQVLAMGGSITAESDVNIGSTFIITLN
ncbi:MULTISPECIES: PAS domain-containing protein [unclassified Maribacter]|uniref:PAS domain-containing protein n=1 Tax=unclassified Maribacter TaxID=2615042 RepID=UPI00257E3C28|nr:MULTISPECIES: PAS domain-containing protein [unclassified Maribacter]|tara:strand:- start:188020 stop:191808 length:3789 start_codon:yes stop_codon:yes gene_type:complete